MIWKPAHALTRCPAFSSLPKYCSLIPDPQDQCCEAPACEGQQPMVGTNQPTQSPFLPPNVTNVVPLGTHSIVSGTSSVAEISQSSSISGGRSKSEELKFNFFSIINGCFACSMSCHEDWFCLILIALLIAVLVALEVSV